jgi:hypothetical protein
MVYLFLSEVALWRTTKVEDHLIVDSSQGERELWINLDVTFHVLPCKGECVLGLRLTHTAAGAAAIACPPQLTPHPLSPPYSQTQTWWTRLTCA